MELVTIEKIEEMNKCLPLSKRRALTRGEALTIRGLPIKLKYLWDEKWESRKQ
jgi:hypothetical protein